MSLATRGVSHVRDRVRRGYRSLFSRRDASPSTAEDYERRALEEIHQLKNPEPSRLGAALDTIHRPIASAADTALDNTVGEAVSKGVEGLMVMLNEQASWSVRNEAIYEQFRSSGHSAVRAGHDIHELELREVDETVGHLAAKSESLAFAEGASTGVLGLAGTALDIPGLVSIALRAINEYAAYYGFDPSLDDEKAFVLMILALVSAPTLEERQAAMTELTKLSVLLAESDSRAESRRLLSMQMVTTVANTLGGRLMRAKAAQSIPIVGAGVAAAFNTWFIKTLTESAFHLYTSRALLDRETRTPGRGAGEDLRSKIV